MRNHKYLFLITLFYFAMGFVNINLSLFGLACMFFPFILLLKNKKKTWCQGYCPRANLYTSCAKLKKDPSRKTPQFFIYGNMKLIMLSYFGISLFFIIMTTLRVANNLMVPMEYLRFFIIIPIPLELPQLLTFSTIAPWITHLSYRFYSLMMTSTILGLILGLVYKPRTWCTICPIATISDKLLEKVR
ncbi:MAG: hypothetical protein CVV02_07205 [Firmicutes bacterium HGW-Firmicutes-7]|nr:MAG: hypothetical protein CVV02_07205 [Firmicutes bacterium HGW-Firmicutes-7]